MSNQQKFPPPPTLTSTAFLSTPAHNAYYNLLGRLMGMVKLRKSFGLSDRASISLLRHLRQTLEDIQAQSPSDSIKGFLAELDQLQNDILDNS